MFRRDKEIKNMKKEDNSLNSQNKWSIKARITLIVGVYAVAFIIIVIMNTLSNQGKSSLMISAIGVIGVLFCLILGVVLLVMNAGDFIFAELSLKEKKYNKKKTSIMNFSAKEKLLQVLDDNKFKEISHDYLYRKKISFWKGTIHYYCKVMNMESTVKGNTIKMQNFLSREYKRFSSMKKKGNKNVGILFISKDNWSERSEVT